MGLLRPKRTGLDVPIKDLSGLRFGKLVCAWPVGKVGKNPRIVWLAFCDCGSSYIAKGIKFKRGFLKTCGCGYRGGKIRHGHAMVGHISPEYRSWLHMVRRCTDPTNDNWKYYGGRGITVCKRWRESFADFLADMGLKSSPKLMVERINNEGNYEPSNCRWATILEQAQNRRPRQCHS